MKYESRIQLGISCIFPHRFMDISTRGENNEQRILMKKKKEGKKKEKKKTLNVDKTKLKKTINHVLIYVRN